MVLSNSPTPSPTDDSIIESSDAVAPDSVDDRAESPESDGGVVSSSPEQQSVVDNTRAETSGTRESLEGSVDKIFEELVAALGPMLEELLGDLAQILEDLKGSFNNDVAPAVVTDALEQNELILALPEDRRTQVLSFARSIRYNRGVARIEVDNDTTQQENFLSDFTNALKARGITTVIGNIPLPEGQTEVTENGIRLIGVMEFPNDLDSSSSSFYAILNSLYRNFDTNFNRPQICIGEPGYIGQISHMMLYLAKNPEKEVAEVISELGYSQFVTSNPDFQIESRLRVVKDSAEIRNRITGTT